MPAVLPPRSKTIPKEKASSFFSGLRAREYRELRNAALTIRDVEWNNLGTRIACALTDKIVRVWNPEKPEIRYSTELRGHTAAVEKISWDPTHPDRLASAGGDGYIRFWDVRSAKCLNSIQSGGDCITMEYSPDGSHLVIGSKDDVVSVIDTKQLQVLKTHREETQTNQIIWTHSGEYVLQTTGNGQVRFRHWPTWEQVYTMDAHASACFCLALDPRGTILAVGGSDALISLWDTKEWLCVNTLTRMENPVRKVGFSFDGAYICGSSDESNNIEIAHVETAEYVATIPTLSPVSSIAWHPNKYYLAYSGEASGLKIVGAGV
ncbi:WD40 repeat-like protein [Ascobolus immersus RN42]|uniref:WD40 repeat-like protein n=1 Tax=Ascobolus immersus RN42 TaxID=1160509 RepID=A0A3N4IDL2_ASCIM|nr:WD40 repeat-like protein [Ascobolus immersus RN42]